MSANPEKLIIDDFSRDDLTSLRGTKWRGISDRVMGGVSEAFIFHGQLDGRSCLTLTGDVSLENNGGFVQATLDFNPNGDSFDATKYAGILLTVLGNDEEYSVHLRTPDNLKSWQSYRAKFRTSRSWSLIELPFAGFSPHRLETPLDRSRLRRLGIVAIGREFSAKVSIAELSFYQ